MTLEEMVIAPDENGWTRVNKESDCFERVCLSCAGYGSQTVAEFRNGMDFPMLHKPWCTPALRIRHRKLISEAQGKHSHQPGAVTNH